MTDDQLVEAFEDATLAADQFSHAAHVRVAWWYLRRYPLGEALARFTTVLKRFAAHHGAEGKYHETVTVAYMLLIAERVGTSPELPFEAFIAVYPELLERRPSVLARYYDAETLSSDRARNGFVMPARAPRRR